MHKQALHVTAPSAPASSVRCAPSPWEPSHRPRAPILRRPGPVAAARPRARVPLVHFEVHAARNRCRRLSMVLGTSPAMGRTGSVVSLSSRRARVRKTATTMTTMMTSRF